MKPLRSPSVVNRVRVTRQLPFDGELNEPGRMHSLPNSTGSRGPGNPPAPPTAPATAITVHVPTPLRACCAGASRLALPAATLREVLEALERSHPALHCSICDETGAVRRHINLFVNTNHMRDCNGLETSLDAGDAVTIMTAVSGG
jgi:sulfur-carrier protein